MPEIAIARNGQFVYVSNRGYDSIGVFAIEAETGRLRSRGWHPTNGRTPRFFALSPDDRFLFAANEDSDTIVSFAVDQRSGALTPTGDVVQVGSPVCIVFGRPPDA